MKLSKSFTYDVHNAKLLILSTAEEQPPNSTNVKILDRLHSCSIYKNKTRGALVSNCLTLFPCCKKT